MASMHARFLPADPTRLNAEDLPTIPAWFPLPARDDQGNPLPALTDEERARARRGRAIAEAVQGPHDGKREQVWLNGDGTPKTQIVLYDGSVVYLLDEALSNRDQLTYRYAPHLSHVHRGTMAAVTEAFNELGAQYALEASTDDVSAPGYAQR